MGLDGRLRAPEVSGDLRDWQTFPIAKVARNRSWPTTLLNAIDAIHRRVRTGRRRSFPPTIGVQPEVIAARRT